ncbi:MAG: carbohydrate ABC transporter substrate-binding protein [Bauldia sp.]|nr:carbohydrate ABC transporter substrate-binding protein [Bauldia sp.]
MTWSHPRGYDPMVACAKLWKEKTGVDVTWDKRSLQDFESFPVDELARNYDMIVIDHPHVGVIVAQNSLAPLDVPGHEADLAALAAASVGPSFASYTYHGRQWALPIDAAAQVQAFRPDLIPGPARTFDAVMALAGEGKVLLPLRNPHALMVFYTLAANLGTPCATDGPRDLIDIAAGTGVFDLMAALYRRLDPACLAMDPIAVEERMSEAGSTFACAPLTYGYVSYALDGFRLNRLAFADIPAAGDGGPRGSAVGGTGIAVSAHAKERQAAIDFAYWIAGAAVQQGPYAAAGGQPGHAAAWDDDAVNAATGGFYRNTRATLEAGWLRPRHHGYMEFQEQASARLSRALEKGEDGGRVVADLNTAYRESFR